MADADFYSFSFTSTSTGHQYQIADDFSFSAGNQWSVDGAMWSGTFGFDLALQQTVGLQFDFDLLVFEDNKHLTMDR